MFLHLHRCGIDSRFLHVENTYVDDFKCADDFMCNDGFLCADDFVCTDGFRCADGSKCADYFRYADYFADFPHIFFLGLVAEFSRSTFLSFITGFGNDILLDTKSSPNRVDFYRFTFRHADYLDTTN